MSASRVPDTTVAVIVPTRDRAQLVRRAVDSVLCQSRPPDEIVVVDDGSTDRTVESLRELQPRVRVIEQEHRGPGAARNRGIRETSAEWLAFLDSDDEWAPQKLERQLAVLSASGRLVCHARQTLVGTKEGDADAQAIQGRIYRQCIAHSAISPSAAIVHRTVLAEVGLFDEEVPACDDYELWLRIAARYPVVAVDEPLVTKQVGHGDQLSAMLWGLDRFRIPGLERAWRTLDLDPRDRIATLEGLIQKLSAVVEGARERRRDDLIEELEHRIPHYQRLLLLERIGLGLEW